MRKSKFMIAAANSGAGKTTLTLGLLKALSDMGLSVQPFKCGPDYIDTLLHTWASDKPSVNLDLFMSSESHLNYLMDKYSSHATVAVVEGVMGLFDGYNKMEGSAAAVSKSLDLPVLLVVNAQASAYSVAALLYGFKNFDPQIKVKGVVFNCVSSQSHYSYLEEACKDVGLEALGYLPKDLDFEIPSRHLGLNTEDRDKIDQTLSYLSKRIQENIDIKRLLELTQVADTNQRVESTQEESNRGGMKIAVARDKAFSFMYHENIESLKRLGEVLFFSPLSDKELPQADLVYLPGGYPEVFAQQLSENSSMKTSIQAYVEAGGRLFAECGGMMYLTRSIVDEKGVAWPMVGIFPTECSMEKMKLSLGYRYFDYKGTRLYGHEFHYSQMLTKLESEAQQFGAKNQPVPTVLMRYKNTIAGYTHLYWADNTNWLNIFN